MTERDQIVSATDTDSLPDLQVIAGLLAKDGQLILPLLDLVEQAQGAIDDLVDVMGRATIEAVLPRIAAQHAGPLFLVTPSNTSVRLWADDHG